MTAFGKVELWTSGTCPFAQRSCIGLKEKGVEFESKLVDLKNKQATPEFEEMYRLANPNPMSNAKVPVLVITDDDGKKDALAESQVVLEALEEMWPKPALLPSDFLGKSRARLFHDAVYNELFSPSSGRSPWQTAGRFLDAEEGMGDVWEAEKEKSFLCESLSALDKSLKHLGTDGPFLNGKSFGYAECMSAPFVQRAETIYTGICGMNVVEICESEGYDRAAAWWRAVLERESVKSTGVPVDQAIKDAQELVNIFRGKK